MFMAATLVAAGLLSLVHICVGQLRFLDRNPGLWKSAAGGTGVSYAFLVLLPKLADAQTALDRVTESGMFGFLAHHSYLVALIGLVVYYGIDAAVENILVSPDRRTRRPAVRMLVYAYAGSLSGYYFLVSYLMSKARETGYANYVSLAVFELAMLLHFLTIDHSLRLKYGGLYDRILRWVFVVASMAGWGVASTTKIPYESLALLNSLFAGALIILILREKVPGRDYVRFGPFIAGAAGYAMLLLGIEVLAQSAW
jgi:hypothetical protein